MKKYTSAVRSKEKDLFYQNSALQAAYDIILRSRVYNRTNNAKSSHELPPVAAAGVRSRDMTLGVNAGIGNCACCWMRGTALLNNTYCCDIVKHI